MKVKLILAVLIFSALSKSFPETYHWELKDAIDQAMSENLVLKQYKIDLNQFEAVLWNYLYRFANRQFYASAFDISVIGGFYVVKKIEMMNLIRIIEARRYGMPREQIRALFIPPL